ncbi:MAG: hypothetical protein K9L17_03750 [Clostridiales bacterium]|nr:hypothetical protein [Clostridiales bacterium]MCF8021792.1 hypothetical protein [Clostridiales bacterium]
MQQQQHPQTQYGQNQVIPEPPSVVSTKDSFYLRDTMSWELLAMKKCNQFAQECMDSQLQHAINTVGQLHQKHYEMLLRHVTPAKSINNI